jgi:hypothetical protein
MRSLTAKSITVVFFLALCGCASPVSRKPAGVLDARQFGPIDPVDEMIRRRARLAIGDVVNAVCTDAQFSKLDPSKFEIVLRSDFDAVRNVVWKVEMRRRGTGQYIMFIVDDSTGVVSEENLGAVADDPDGALRLLKEITPYLGKDSP